MPIRKLATTDSRELITSDNIPLAILKVAASLEHILFKKLHFEKQINPDLMYRWTLGTYIRWCVKNDLIDKKYEALLIKFNKTRNLFVHGRTVYNKIKNDKSKEQKIKNLLISICDFIDQTEVSYKHDPKLEHGYSSFLDRKDKEMDLF